MTATTRVTCAFLLLCALASCERRTTHDAPAADLVKRQEVEAESKNQGDDEWAEYAAGRYKNALDMFTRWVPVSDCGNAWAAMCADRIRGIALCHIQLNDHGAAAKVCLDSFHQTPRWDGRNASEIVYCLYRDAEQLDDLRRLVDQLEDIELRRRSAIRPVPEEFFFNASFSRLRELAFAPDGLDPEIEAESKELHAMKKPKVGSLPKTLP